MMYMYSFMREYVDVQACNKLPFFMQLPARIRFTYVARPQSEHLCDMTLPRPVQREALGSRLAGVRNGSHLSRGLE